MDWLKLSVLLFSLSVITATPWGANQAWGQQDGNGNSNDAVYKNQLKEAANASAELRKSKGLRRSTTNDARQAAAARNVARKAALIKEKGGGHENQ